MLETSPGNFILEILYALLMLEDFFNALDKINFNSKLMPALEALSSTPQEIIGMIRSQATTHLALSKKLIVDISNTKKLSTDTTFNDATN